MSEQQTDSLQTHPRRSPWTGVVVATIVCATLIALGCIAAFTVVAYLFMVNAPG